MQILRKLDLLKSFKVPVLEVEIPIRFASWAVALASLLTMANFVAMMRRIVASGEPVLDEPWQMVDTDGVLGGSVAFGWVSAVSLAPALCLACLVYTTGIVLRESSTEAVLSAALLISLVLLWIAIDLGARAVGTLTTFARRRAEARGASTNPSGLPILTLALLLGLAIWGLANIPNAQQEQLQRDPRQVAQAWVGTTRWRAVDMADKFACGISNDSRWLCWGDVALADSPIARLLSITPPSGKFIELSLSDEGGCGVSEGGELACFGRVSEKGRPLGGTWQHVSAETWGGCVISQPGNAQCWGDFDVRTPDGTFKEIGTGAGYVCGILANGVVKCWGPESLDPGSLAAPAGEFHGLSVASWAGCAISNRREVACWGALESAHIKHGTVERADSITSPMHGEFVSIKLTDDRLCGIRTSGALECWGYVGNWRQLEVPAGSDFVSVASASGEECAVRRNGKVICWPCDSKREQSTICDWQR